MFEIFTQSSCQKRIFKLFGGMIMRKMISAISVFICSFFAAGFLTSCNSPLGLGAVVNTNVPVIRIPTEKNGSGSFLTGKGENGENRIYLEVEQKYGLKSVIVFVEYTDKNAQEKQTKSLPANIDAKTGFYYVDLDVSEMEDGIIKTWVKATDVSGNITTTTDIIYNVKNAPPQIEMNIPAIKGVSFDARDLNSNLLPNDPVYIGFDLMGFATDNLGIAEGFPKIMFWPADLSEVDSDGLPLPAADKRYNTWRSLVLSNTSPGQTAVKFSWPMVNLVADTSAESGWRLPKKSEKVMYLDLKKYRFKIWIRDLHGRDNYYPNRADNTVNNGKPVEPSKHPNKYMEVNYIAAEIPIISIKSIPQYYNGVGDFTVELGISSQSSLTGVKAWITDKNDGNPKFTSDVYDAAYISETGSQHFYNYKLTITEEQAKAWRAHATENGNMYLNLEAKDSSDKSSPPTNRQFIFDIVPANVTYDRPVIVTSPYANGSLTGGKYEIYYPVGDRPKWVTGKITVGGLSQDQFGIKKVYYHIGKLGDDKSSNRESIYKNAGCIDTKLETNNPGEGWGGSVYAWTYSGNFNSYKTRHGDLVQSHNDFTFPAGIADTETTGKFKDRFYLPFYVKVIDNADNQTIVHYKLCIDPNLDYPFADIAYPHERDLIGGEVRVSGTANDNDWMHTVMMRIWNAEKKEYYIPMGAVEIYKVTPAFPGFVPAPADDKAGWFRVNKQGDDVVVGWNYTINSDNGLNPPAGKETINVRIDVRAVDTKDPGRQTPGLVGWTTSMNMQFSSAVPTITQQKIIKANVEDRDYAEGIRASGKFIISMLITDADDINSVRARFVGQNYTDLIKGSAVQGGLPAGWNITAPKLNKATGRLESALTIVCDTINDPLFNIGYGKTGNITLDVQVTNSHVPAPYTTSGSYSIGIDNYYPGSVINTGTIASGAAFELKGIAKDYGDGSGSVQGLERVLVYFEKAKIVYTKSGDSNIRTVQGTGEYVNPRNVSIPVSGAGAGDAFYDKTGYANNGITWNTSMPAMTTYPNVRDTTQANGFGGTNGPNTAVFQTFPVLKLVNKGGNIGEVWESPHAMVIDRQELGDATDTDGDGTLGEVWDGLADMDWQARMNTTRFRDGPLMLHYIVMDKAGNAVHYQKDIFIANNKPVIRNINLGTDINGNGSVDPWKDPDAPGNKGKHGEFMQYRRMVENTDAGNRRFDSNFRIRNNRFALRLETSSGNGTKTLKASYVTPHSAPMSASAMVQGGVYTISYDGNTEWDKLGSPNNYQNTTFVASGPGTGTGTVIQYTEVSSQTQTFTGNEISATLFNSQTHFTKIPDSIKTNGDILTHNQRLFIVKVYDSTVAEAPEADQLAHAVLVAVDVDNNDKKLPEVLINPFYWKSSTDNSLYEGLRTNGHIELEADLPRPKFGGAATGLLDLDPKVSGKISVRGTVSDNNTLKEIRFSFTGLSGGDILAAEDTPGSGWTTYGDLDALGWKFSIVHEVHDLTGHVIEWQLDMDTNKTVSTGAAIDRVLSVFAKDLAVNASVSKTYRMDVVPYISDIQTSQRDKGGLKSVNIRSADGKYSIRQTAGNTITVKGFNLNPGSVRIFSTSAHNSYDPGAAPPSGGSGVAVVTAVAVNSTAFTITNESSLRSGYLAVWTNGIGSLNNINNNNSRGSFVPVTSGSNASNGFNQENMPNREADRYTVKNITLTDDRYVQFFGSVDTSISNSGYPVMIMNGDNPVFGYVKDNGGPNSNPGTTTGGAGTYYPTYAAPQRREVNGSTGAEIYTEYLIKGSMWDGMGMTRDDSGRYLHATTFARDGGTFHLIYDRFNEIQNPTGADSGRGWGTGVAFSATPNFAHADNNNALALETVSYNGQLGIFRYQYPKFISKGDSTTNPGAAYYLVYFDDITNELAFRNFRIGKVPGYSRGLSTTGADFPESTGRTSASDYNGVRSNMTEYSGTHNATSGGAVDNANASALNARKTAASNASRFFDFGVTDGNIVVVVYYDEGASKLRMRYSSGAVDGSSPKDNVDWTDSALSFPANVGMHVSMVVDGNALHIAALDSNDSDLCYIYVQDYRNGSANNKFKAVTVDQSGVVGSWTQIKLQPGTKIPYISYYNASETGSRESLKLAYSKAAVTSAATALAGVDSNGYTTGNWEYVTVPAHTPPNGGEAKFQRVNLGFRTDGMPVLGYLGSNIEFSYQIGE